MATPSEIHADPDTYAKQNKLKIVKPGPRELQLDIDSPRTPEHYGKHLSILRTIISVTDEKISVSRSGNLHVTLTVGRDLTSIERGFFQACLGSDPARELLTYRNIQQGEPDAQFLFEKEQ